MSDAYRTEVAELLRFPAQSLEKFPHTLTSTELDKFSLSEVQKWQVKWPPDSGEIICVCDWERGFVLWFDESPLWLISYDQTAKTVLIRQIQSITQFAIETKNRVFRDNFLLKKFEWRKVLVDVIERMAIINAKRVICITPSLGHPAFTSQKSSQLSKIYDGNAIDLGYQQTDWIIGTVGVYYKFLHEEAKLKDIPPEWRSFLSRDFLSHTIFNNR